MKHLGDVTKINGGFITPVDIITFGAPCQDISCAGKRAGMKHEAVGDDETTRSGLFYEAIRIIKEMREHDRSTGRAGKLLRPRYAVYENVPGLTSSNGGKDFAAVLTYFVRIVEPEAPDICVPESGNWSHAGGFYGVGADGQPFSVAWRLHDAQYHGVPQRRKRYCVLGDFAGFTAPWILFDPQFERASESGEPYQTLTDIGAEPQSQVRSERPCLSGNPQSGGTPGQGTSQGTKSGVGDTGEEVAGTLDASYYKGCGERQGVERDVVIDRNAALSFQERAGKPGGGKGILIQDEHTGALSTLNIQSVCAYSIGSFNSGGMMSDNPTAGIHPTDVGRTVDNNGGNPAAYQGGLAIMQDSSEPILLESNQNHATVQTGGISTTLPASMGEGGGYVPMITERDTAFGIDQQGGKGGANYCEGVSPPILSDSHGTPHAVAFTPESREAVKTFPIEGNGQRESHQGDGFCESDVMYTLNTIERHGAAIAFAQNQRDEVRDLNDVAGSVSAESGMHQQTYVAGFSFGQSANARSLGYQEEVSPTVRGGDGGNQKPVVVAVDCRNGVEDPNINGTLQAKSNGGYNTNSNNIVRVQACDVYNQTIEGEVAPTVTAAVGGGKHKRPESN